MRKMISQKKIAVVAFAVIGVSGMIANNGFARVNTLSTSISIGTEYLDQDKREGSGDYYFRNRLNPNFYFTTESEKDELNFLFSPSVRYDHYTDDSDFDLTTGLDGARSVTENWRVGFSEKFTLTDTTDYSGDDIVEDDDLVSDDDGRRDYWKNDFSLFSDYSYAPDSNYRLTYIYNKLENDDGDISDNYEDYDKHTFRFNLNHTFDPYWSSSFSSSYVRGLYDSPNDTSDTDSDLKEYRLSAGVTSKVIDHHIFTLSYSYTGTNYDDNDNNSDSDLHSGTLSWQHDYSPEISFDASSGATYEDSDGYKGRWGWNGGAGMDYRFERGFVRLSAEQRFDAENFTGSTSDSGTKRIQEAKVNTSYQLFEETTVGSFITYREERQEDTPGGENIDTDKWIVGASLSQGLWENYSSSLSYNYIDQDSDRVGDTYDEHRLSLSLTYATELLKW